MKRIIAILFILCLSTISYAQKKPLTHQVYDGWKSVGERNISNDGNYIFYSINPQEGDGNLYVQNTNDSGQRKIVARGYNVQFLFGTNIVVSKIKPFFADTRQAKIKKKKPEEMPKDSLAIVYPEKDSIEKVARVKAYKVPEKNGNWLAVHLEKALPDTSTKQVQQKRDTALYLSKVADSIIKKSLDSVKGKISREQLEAIVNKAAKEIYKKAKDNIFEEADADEPQASDAPKADGTDLLVKNFATGKSSIYKLVSDFVFDKYGTKLLLRTSKNTKDSLSKARIILIDLAKQKSDTILSGLNDAANFAFDEKGTQLVFVAERDSSNKALQKFYKLYYFNSQSDSAIVIVDRKTKGMPNRFSISENAGLFFSKDGSKLFFGTAPIQPAKDTTLVDFELARLDVWHYNDDYIQPQQLKNASQEQKRSYLAVMQPKDSFFNQISDSTSEIASTVNEGNANWVLLQSTSGNRLQSQWEGRAKYSAWVEDVLTGRKLLVKANTNSFFQASPKGRYVYWYDPELKNYFTYNVATSTTKNITSAIKVPLWDTENDVPDFPRNIGIVGWTDNDDYLLLYDEYDIWKVQPDSSGVPQNLTNSFGRKNKMEFKNVVLNTEKRFYQASDTLLLTAQSKANKQWSIHYLPISGAGNPQFIQGGAYSISNIRKALNANSYLLTQSSIRQSELYTGKNLAALQQITNIAEQQKEYNWLTAELVKWKMFDGKISEGMLFKPENFDSTKKYPLIFYFYERNSDELYTYRSPAPSASTINIPWFVSNGYLVFDPNIYYKKGEPGESAYNSVVSAARHLAKLPWVDSTRMGIQGQSWGGYQVAYLVTRTNIFRAAGAGAPVSNMTSAYGGIRWGSGLVRQFQYEKQQSRIGATLWQRPDLYIKNSPLFAADKIQTPLLIMHNDADGAVPWYQGIEYFSALRRLGKKVWLLQYNGEDHNLIERKNRKDLSVRLGQFFDYYLKGAKPARWILGGLPATEKGRSWGLEVVE